MLAGEHSAHLGHCTLRVIGTDVERRYRERARHDDRAFARGLSGRRSLELILSFVTTWGARPRLTERRGHCCACSTSSGWLCFSRGAED